MRLAELLLRAELDLLVLLATGGHEVELEDEEAEHEEVDCGEREAHRDDHEVGQAMRRAQRDEVER